MYSVVDHEAGTNCEDGEVATKQVGPDATVRELSLARSLRWSRRRHGNVSEGVMKEDRYRLVFRKHTERHRSRARSCMHADEFIRLSIARKCTSSYSTQHPDRQDNMFPQSRFLSSMRMIPVVLLLLGFHPVFNC